MDDPRDVLDWIESIPFYETRNYVQRVLENLQIYRSILNENNGLRIVQDLVLNKKKGTG
jgi:soluble lytic murein transglycosylase